ncbi:MAG: hypothetical protein ABIF92_02895 [archaeon]
MVTDTPKLRDAAYHKAEWILNRIDLITNPKAVADPTIFGPVYASAFFIIANKKQNLKNLCDSCLKIDMAITAGLSHAFVNFEVVREILLSDEFSNILKLLLPLGKAGRDRLVAAKFMKEKGIKKQINSLLSQKKLYNKESITWLAPYFSELLIYECGRFMKTVPQFELARLFNLTK